MFDPEDTTTEDATGSSDASKPGFHKAWEQWTSKPENNAALLQFGISMLQPRSPGQSGVGAFANSIAQGGEAGGRVIQAQKADDLAASTEEDKKALRETQRVTANAGADANAAYAENLRANNGLKGTSPVLKAQQGFRSWLAKPEDTTGLMADPILGAIQKRFPEVKTKADLLANPAAKMEAFRIFSTVDPESADTSTPAPAGGLPPVNTALPGGLAIGTQRAFRDKATGAMKTFTWDGTQWK